MYRAAKILVFAADKLENFFLWPGLFLVGAVRIEYVFIHSEDTFKEITLNYV